MNTPPDFGLWTMGDIAAYLQVSPVTLKYYRKKQTMPQQVGYVGQQPVWTTEQVEEWKEARRNGPMRRYEYTTERNTA